MDVWTRDRAEREEYRTSVDTEWTLSTGDAMAHVLVHTARALAATRSRSRPTRSLPGMDVPPFAASAAALELEPWPLDPGQVVAGAPEVRGLVLHADETGERGVWEHGPGVSRDVEADELFVVLSGRATIEFEDGTVLEIGPGDVGVLPAGARTTWRVHETLRKVFQTRR